MTEVLGAIVGAVVSGFLFYRLGIRQGKQQIRYEESFRALTEIRQKLLDLRDEFRDWVSGLPFPDSPHERRILDKWKDLQRYYEEKRVVLDRDTRIEVERLLKSVALPYGRRAPPRAFAAD